MAARYPVAKLIGAGRASVVEQAADDAAEQAAAGLTLGVAAAAILLRRVEVGALQPDPARTGEAIEDEVAGAAAEEARS